MTARTRKRLLYLGIIVWIAYGVVWILDSVKFGSIILGLVLGAAIALGLLIAMLKKGKRVRIPSSWVQGAGEDHEIVIVKRKKEESDE